jgi:hypothetical protein
MEAPWLADLWTSSTLYWSSAASSLAAAFMASDSLDTLGMLMLKSGFPLTVTVTFTRFDSPSRHALACSSKSTVPWQPSCSGTCTGTKKVEATHGKLPQVASKIRLYHLIGSKLACAASSLGAVVRCSTVLCIRDGMLSCLIRTWFKLSVWSSAGRILALYWSFRT